MGKKCLLKTIALAVDEKEKAIESRRGKLTAGGDLHGSEKLGWSAGDMAKESKNQMKLQHQQNEKHRQMKINENTQYQK